MGLCKRANVWFSTGENIVIDGAIDDAFINRYCMQVGVTRVDDDDDPATEAVPVAATPAQPQLGPTSDWNWAMHIWPISVCSCLCKILFSNFNCKLGSLR